MSDQWHEHLSGALADDDKTVAVLSVDATSLVCQTRSVRTRDLVMAARSLLSLASDLLDDGSEVDLDDDSAELLDQVTAALAELPDDDA